MGMYIVQICLQITDPTMISLHCFLQQPYPFQQETKGTKDSAGVLATHLRQTKRNKEARLYFIGRRWDSLGNCTLPVHTVYYTALLCTKQISLLRHTSFALSSAASCAIVHVQDSAHIP